MAFPSSIQCGAEGAELVLEIRSEGDETYGKIDFYAVRTSSVRSSSQSKVGYGSPGKTASPMYDPPLRELPGTLGDEDVRFLAPLLTVTEAGRNLLISSATVKDWQTHELVHSVAPLRRGAPTLPLAGVAEAQVLRGLRLSGLPPTEIARVTRSLREELGEYALIKERLAHDGRSVFRDVARRTDAPQWVRVRDGQLLLPKVVDDHLTYLEWAPDGFPVRLRLRSYRQANADVILDPRFGYGKPVFERTKVRTKDVMRQFLAGEKPEDIASDYDLTEDEVLAAIRVLSGHRDAA